MSSAPPPPRVSELDALPVTAPVAETPSLAVTLGLRAAGPPHHPAETDDGPRFRDLVDALDTFVAAAVRPLTAQHAMSVFSMAARDDPDAVAATADDARRYFAERCKRRLLELFAAWDLRTRLNALDAEIRRALEEREARRGLPAGSAEAPLEWDELRPIMSNPAATARRVRKLALITALRDLEGMRDAAERELARDVAAAHAAQSVYRDRVAERDRRRARVLKLRETIAAVARMSPEVESVMERLMEAAEGGDTDGSWGKEAAMDVDAPAEAL